VTDAEFGDAEQTDIHYVQARIGGERDVVVLVPASPEQQMEDINLD
jgi:hypothetical protein